MTDWIYANLSHFLVLALLLARGALLIVALGLLLMLFYPTSDSWGFYAAQGVLLYAAAVFLHTCLFFRGLRNAAHARSPAD